MDSKFPRPYVCKAAIQLLNLNSVFLFHDSYVAALSWWREADGLWNSRENVLTTNEACCEYLLVFVWMRFVRQLFPLSC